MIATPRAVREVGADDHLPGPWDLPGRRAGTRLRFRSGFAGGAPWSDAVSGGGRTGLPAATVLVFRTRRHLGGGVPYRAALRPIRELPTRLGAGGDARQCFRQPVLLAAR